jgi:hypothetical protein
MNARVKPTVPWFFRIVFQLDHPRTIFLRLYGLAARSGQIDDDVRFICESGPLVMVSGHDSDRTWLDHTFGEKDPIARFP